MIKIINDYQLDFQQEKKIDDYLNLKGEHLRTVGQRRVSRFSRGGQDYYLKCHFGVGWKEIIKNIVTLKLPVVDSRLEWKAIQKFAQVGILTITPVAYGLKGWNPARRKSFIITKDLGPNISLEKLTMGWTENFPALTFKWTLIEKVAQIAHLLHSSGMNHQDFYLCHFLIPLNKEGEVPSSNKLSLYLIDLHRVQIRSQTSRGLIVKDIAALLFSSLGIGLTTRDLFRFIKVYKKKSLRSTIKEDIRLWRQVKVRAFKLYRAHWNRDPSLKI